MKLFSAIAVLCAALPTCIDAGQFGTGFAISPRGYIVTCHHVVRDAKRVVVHSDAGTTPAQIVALDPRNDLAVLKIHEWKGISLGLTPSSTVSYASTVTVIGFPDPTILGTNPKVSTGIVNSLSGVHDDPRYLQVSAPVQPGNSGGPVISDKGQVVGVIAAGLNSVDRMTHSGYVPQSVNYAIKSDLIFPLLKTAAVKTPRFGTRASRHQRQINRALSAIVLVEALVPGQARPLINRSPVNGATPPIANAAAPIAPWVFPDSHARLLSTREVKSLPPETLWRARNEIYLRRGFHFTSPEGARFAGQFGPFYRPSTDSFAQIQKQLSPVEINNLRMISTYEARHR